MKCVYLTYLSNLGGAARLLTLTVLTVYADFFAAKINLKFQPKITSKNILASKKILGESSHVFHTVYVKFIERGALEGT